MHLLCLLPLVTGVLEDRGILLARWPRIHFSAIHYAEGRDTPRQLVIRGTPGGLGYLELNPNELKLNSRGMIYEQTLIGYVAEKVQIKLTGTSDPEKKGRKVYDIDIERDKNEKGYNDLKFQLILTADEAGPHHLLIWEGEKVFGPYPLVSPNQRRR